MELNLSIRLIDVSFVNVSILKGMFSYYIQALFIFSNTTNKFLSQHLYQYSFPHIIGI